MPAPRGPRLALAADRLRRRPAGSVSERRRRRRPSPRERELASLEEAFLEAHRLRRLAEQEGGEAPSAEEKQRMLREARRLLQGLLGKLLDNDGDNDDD